MVDTEESEEFRAIVAPGLRLAFRWLGDRWTHSLDLEDGPSAWRTVAEAVEGGDERAQAAGPAFQQLQFQRGEEGVYALAVGQSGPRHFSAAFHVTEPDGGVCVEADVADRCRKEADPPASTYRVLLPLLDVIDADDDRVVWSPGAGPSRLEFAAWGLPPARSRIGLAEAGRVGALVQALASPEAVSGTRLWRYLWRWTPGKL